jgi:hypothetical protein
MQLSPSSHHSSLLGPNILLSNLFSNTLSAHKNVYAIKFNGKFNGKGIAWEQPYILTEYTEKYLKNITISWISIKYSM